MGIRNKGLQNRGCGWGLVTKRPTHEHYSASIPLLALLQTPASRGPVSSKMVELMSCTFKVRIAFPPLTFGPLQPFWSELEDIISLSLSLTLSLSLSQA